MKHAHFAAVVILLAVSSAFSMEPVVGRIYTAAYSPTNAAINLYSMPMLQDGTVGNAYQHALIRQNMPNGIVQTISPEIVNTVASGYATVTFGYWSSSAPASHNPGDEGGPKNPVMQIVQMVTTAGAQFTQVVGKGKAYDGTNYDTDGGAFAMYDRYGTFSGVSGSYFTSVVHGNNTNVQINYNSGGLADITDSGIDYHGALRNAPGMRDNDQEIVGNKLFISSGMLSNESGIGSDCPAIYYYTYQNNTLVPHRFYDNNAGSKQLLTSSKIAAGKVSINGQLRDSVWAITGDIASSPSAGSIQLVQFVDLDGDGTAEGEGETRAIVTSGEIAGLNINANWADLEVVSSMGTDYLLAADPANQKLVAFQLNPDGTFAGVGTANPADFLSVQTAKNIQENFEFDPNGTQVPEPVTMGLLLASAFGFIRRRKA